MAQTLHIDVGKFFCCGYAQCKRRDVPLVADPSHLCYAHKSIERQGSPLILYSDIAFERLLPGGMSVARHKMTLSMQR